MQLQFILNSLKVRGIFDMKMYYKVMPMYVSTSVYTEAELEYFPGKSEG